MFDQYSIIFGERVQTYTIAMILAVCLSIGWVVWSAPTGKKTKTLDMCLASLLGAVVVGRVVHVGLHWAFFATRSDLILRMGQEGGLSWQGAVFGALIAGGIMAKIRQVEDKPLLSSAVVIVPMLSLFAWYSCTTAGCAYGAPVDRLADYPQWMVWSADDIYRLNMPRFATQPIGMVVSLILLVVSLVIYSAGWLKHNRFWLMLFAVSLLSFGVGFLRGDYALTLVGLRTDQWLDVGVMALCLVMIVVFTRKPATE